MSEVAAAAPTPMTTRRFKKRSLRGVTRSASPPLANAITNQVRRRIVAALQAGIEDVPIGAVAEEILARWADNPKEIERGIGS